MADKQGKFEYDFTTQLFHGVVTTDPDQVTLYDCDGDLLMKVTLQQWGDLIKAWQLARLRTALPSSATAIRPRLGTQPDIPKLYTIAERERQRILDLEDRGELTILEQAELVQLREREARRQAEKPDDEPPGAA